MSAIEEKSLSESESSNEQKLPALTDGFHLIIDALKLNGIDTIYGVPGIPITDLARLAQAEGIRFISFRHEQSAGNAAAIAGYLTKKPGICLTVSAPGFLNGSGGTGECYHQRLPHDPDQRLERAPHHRSPTRRL
jgi:oxalyl-CoA decarboxylase